MIWLIGINFCLLICTLVFNFRFLKNYFFSFERKLWLVLVLIFFLAFFVRLFVPVLHHEIYIDEPWYQEAARNIVESNSIGDYQKSIAWPFLLSLVFGTFGVNNWYGIYLAIFFGALTVFPLYFLSFELTRKKYYSLLAPLCLALMPVHIFWSATGETISASIFFSIISLFFIFLYLKKKDYRLLWLSIFTVAFTSQLRPENYFYFIIFIFAWYLFEKNNLWNRQYRNLIPWILGMLLVLPNLFKVINFSTSRNWVESDSLAKISGANWSISNLFHNTINYGWELLWGQSVLVLFLGIAGLLFLYHRKKEYFKFTSFWFLGFWLIYFSVWMQTLGGRTRFYIIFEIIISILAVWGLAWLDGKIKRGRSLSIVIIIISMIIGIYSVFSVSNRSYRIHALRLESEMPEFIKNQPWQNCLLIMNETKVLEPDKNFHTMRLDDYLKNRQEVLDKNECVMFYEDWYCVRQDGGSRKNDCEKIKKEFKNNLINSYSLEEIKYSFYKLIRQPAKIYESRKKTN